MGEHTAEDTASREAAIEKELLALLHVRTPSLLAVNVVNGVLVVFVLRDEVPASWLTTWAIGFDACMLWRAAMWLRLRNKDQPDWSRRWRRYSLIGTILAALFWGAFGGLFFVPGSAPHVLFQAFVIGGMTAGALGSITVLQGGYEVYLILSAAPFGARLALSGQPQFLTMAAMGAIYIAVLLYIGRQSRKSLAEAVSLRFDNADLVRTLDTRVRLRTGELERVNAQLAEDIERRQRAEQDLARYADRQAAVADLGQQALTGIGLDALFRKVVDAATAGLAVSCAAVLEYVPESNVFVVRAAVGARTETGTDDGRRVPVDFESVAGRALFGENETGRGVVQQQEPAEPHCRTAAAAVPIWWAGRRFGVLEVCNREPRLLTEDDRNFLQALAAVLAAAIQRKQDEVKMQRLAHYDPLTGLPNRALFRDLFASAVSRVRRSHDQLALFMIDLDHFKNVNDTRGHAFGDRLLAQVASRLRTCLRAMDTPARLGGDEFAVILSDLHGPADAATIARKVVAALSQPFSLNGDELHVGASIGVTLCPSDGDQPDALLRNADLALYRAKAEGGGRFAFFSAEMAADVEWRRTLEQNLRRALSDGQLQVYYQPQVALADHRIVGAEALLRWPRPGAGFVSNADFIPVAEQTSLIQVLGSWVLHRVCAQAHNWRLQGHAPSPRRSTCRLPSACTGISKPA